MNQGMSTTRPRALLDWRDAQDRRWALLAGLYLLTVCTTLRLPGLPVGAGELGLLAAGLAVLRFRERLLDTLRAYRWLLGFVLAYVALLVAGAALSAQAGRLSTGWAHDLVALLFASATAFVFLVLAGDSGVAVDRLQRGLVWGATALSLFAFLLVIGDYLAGRPLLSGVVHANLWWPGRFSAWSTDPNQWGMLLLVAIMLLALMPGRPRYLLLAMLVWLLLEVRSDAGLAGLLAFGFAHAGLAAWRRPDLRRHALIVLAVIIVAFGLFRQVADRYPPSPVVRVVGVVANIEPPAKLLKRAKRLLSQGSSAFIGGSRQTKLGERLAIWRNSIEAWRVSPVVGLGPGAYSGSERPFQNTESHNLLVQVLVNTGVAGVLLVLSGLLALGLMLWRSPATVPWLAGLAGLLAQGMGHYLMRHPLFWLFIAVLAWQAVHGRASNATTKDPQPACPVS